MVNQTVAFSGRRTVGPGESDNEKFSVAGGELQTNEPLPVGEYSLRLRATNQSGAFLEDSFAISVVPGMVPGKVAAGGHHSVRLDAEGTVFTFGAGSSGQLGHGDTSDQFWGKPIGHESLAGHTVTEVAAGSCHTVLLTTDGAVFTFGAHTNGQLGHELIGNGWIPRQIMHEALSERVIVDIAAGSFHTVLLSSDGTCLPSDWASMANWDMGIKRVYACRRRSNIPASPPTAQCFRSEGNTLANMDTRMARSGLSRSPFPSIGNPGTGCFCVAAPVTGTEPFSSAV